jgi:hypothetical protein
VTAANDDRVVFLSGAVAARHSYLYRLEIKIGENS